MLKPATLAPPFNFSLLETAQKLIMEAEKYYRDGDEEMAYVFYTRYFNLLHSIHKRPDYIESKPLIRQMLGDNRSNKMTMDRLEALANSLNDRYDRLNAKATKVATLSSNAVQASASISNNDRSRSNSPRCNNIVDISAMRLMSCQQLFEAMKAQDVLVLDCRSADDYKSSHLNYALSLNVPEELIQAG